MDSGDDWVEEGEDYCSDGFSDGGGSEFMEDDEFVDKERPSVNYSALSESDIRQYQEDAIARVCSVLSISRVGAALLLGQYQWSLSNAEEAWFADEDGVRKAIGLLENPVVQFPGSEEEITCRICYDRYPVSDDKFASAACGHLFCKVCWSSYINIAIVDGGGCLKLRCPEPKCVAAVGQDMVHSLASDEAKTKYDHYLLRSYIENNKKMKWCPAPGCSNAVKFEFGSEVYDVYCLCLNGFCWNCGEDAHRPVDCQTVSSWIIKNSAESENVNWLLANSKPCPKCKLPIEKNQGCMHMTCRPPCKFEFCWLCLGPWEDHGERTGGFYACNKYEKAKQAGELDEDEVKRKMAKDYIEKYAHYFERWQNNENSRKKAILDLQNMKNVHIKKLSNIQATSETQLQFIIDAWSQIIECRRKLKWTYAYGYYLSDEEETKKKFFEYLQGQAESGLERLHKCAEQDIVEHQDAKGPTSNFADFRVKLLDLTRVTRTYFDNLVGALENGLSDVADDEVCKSAEKARKESAGKGKNGGSNRIAVVVDEGEDGVRRWFCTHCNYMNPETVTACVHCEETIDMNGDD